ncbi:MAG: AAA family ATPase [Planctomycetes bacterium]|nr:AAA family ATPase [Planctomycetota bacterium]
MTRPCPSCGCPNPAAAKFCNECGQRMAAPAAVPAGLTPPPAAEYVTRRIRKDDAGKRGERRLVSVLFADIKDYTALSERLDPEQIEDLVGGLFREFSEVVTSQGGYVDKFMGDAVLALFGAPRTYGDDAERAVTCALEMQRRAKAANSGRDVQLDVRIGIDSGEVVVGNLGQRGEYTAIGDAVNTANRVQNAAQPGSVYISDATAAQVKLRFRLAELPPVALKGKTEPVVLYRVEGPARVTEHYAGPFIGRKRELDLLAASFEAAVRDRRPRFVLVRADAGMGKSRLFYEFRRRLRAQRHAPARLTAAFAPVGMEPMQGMRQLARGLLGLEPNTAPAAVESAIAAACTGDEQAPQTMAEHLKYLLGHDLPALAGSGLEWKQRREGAAVAMKHLLRRKAAQGPLLLVFEDLHWADADSISFLRNLARSDFAGPVLVLAFGRPEAIELVRDLLADPLENIELRPLEADEVSALSGGVLREGTVDSALASLIAERSGGNPFVIEELVKSLQESGVLQLAEGRYRLASGHTAAQIPVGVRSILAARIDALPPAERAVLSAVSVLGREFRAGIAHRLCGEETGPAVAGLVARGLLLDLGEDRGQRRYMFCHALLQEVAYGGLLKRDKSALHRAAAAYYTEQMAADGRRDPRRAARLAWHHAAAGQHADACRLYLESGREAAREWMGPFAAEQLAAALSEFDRAAGVSLEGRPAAESRAVLALELVDALNNTGKMAEALELARSVLPETTGALRARLLDRAAHCSDRKGDFAGALACSSEAEALHREAGDDQTARRSSLTQVALLTALGRGPEARVLLESLAPGAAAADDDRLAYCKAAASLLNDEGRTREALGQEQQRLELARRAGNRRATASALANVALFLSDLGRLEEARGMFAEALREHRASGDLFNQAVVLANYGNFLRRTGDLPAALAVMEEARRLSADLGDEYGVMLGEFNIATVQINLGSFNEAARSFDRSAALRRRFQSAQLEVQALQNIGLTALRLGDFRQARACIEKARALNQQRGNERGLLQNDQTLAEDLIRAGEFARATELLRGVMERARAAGFVRLAIGAAAHLMEVALLQSDRAALQAAVAAHALLLPGESAQPDDRLMQNVHGLIARLQATGQGVAELAAALPRAAVNNTEATVQAAAVVGAATVPLGPDDARTALGWAETVAADMERGGRADTLFAAVLLARARLKDRCGRDGKADAARARALAQRLECEWLLRDS